MTAKPFHSTTSNPALAAAELAARGLDRLVDGTDPVRPVDEVVAEVAAARSANAKFLAKVTTANGTWHRGFSNLKGASCPEAHGFNEAELQLEWAKEADDSLLEKNWQFVISHNIESTKKPQLTFVKELMQLLLDRLGSNPAMVTVGRIDPFCLGEHIQKYATRTLEEIEEVEASFEEDC